MQKKSEKKFFWQQLEATDEGAKFDADEAIRALQFDADGLLPVVAQCAESGAVLMLAWANAEALRLTMAEGRMVYYSRSRACLWRKGETSGHVQKLVSLAADCDGDALLARVLQTGAACHTMRRTCFYARLAPDAGIHESE